MKKAIFLFQAAGGVEKKNGLLLVSQACQYPNSYNPLIPKSLLPNFFCGIYAKVIEKYKKGWSLRDIAKDVGVSKNGIRSILLKGKITLRENITHATNKRKLNSGKNGALSYFGFCYTAAHKFGDIVSMKRL